jgi:hypothetical protein
VAGSFRETVLKIECNDVSSFNSTENETEWGKGELSKVTVCENKQVPETTARKQSRENCHNGFVGNPYAREIASMQMRRRNKQNGLWSHSRTRPRPIRSELFLY